MYLAAYAVSMTFAGRLSDLYGRRPAYLVCLVIFIAGSILVALTRTPGLSPSFSLEWLVISRVIQALGAGAMVPVSMALVGDLFPPERRASPLGLIAAVDTAGWVVGHLYGGIMIRLFTDWRLIFWLNVPIGVLAFALCWRALRDVPQQRHKGRLDLIGALLIGLALAAFNIAVGGGAEAGTTSQFVEQTTPAYQGPLLIVAIAAFIAFIFRELRAEQPLLDLRLFKQKTFSGASLVNLCVGFALIVALGVVPLFINAVVASSNPDATAAQILSDGAWYTGWVLSALTVTMAIMSLFIGRIVNRFGYRAPTLIGLLIAAIGFYLTSRWDVNTTYWQMVPGLLVAGLGFGMVLAPDRHCGGQQRAGRRAWCRFGAGDHFAAGGHEPRRIDRVELGHAARAGAQRRIGCRAKPVRRRYAGDFPQATAQAVAESFLLFAVVACLVALLPAWLMRATPQYCRGLMSSYLSGGRHSRVTFGSVK